MAGLVWHLEDPRVGQCYPNYYAAQLAGKFGKVVLSGVGGDEMFAGYPWRYYRTMNNSGFQDYVDLYYDYWHRLIPTAQTRNIFAPIWPEVKDVRTRNIFAGVFDNHKRTNCRGRKTTSIIPCTSKRRPSCTACWSWRTR